MRLNKFLARAGVCSRRKAEELIASGKVRVSGHTVQEMGFKLDPETARVEVHGIGRVKLESQSFLYLILNKPIRVLSTVSDPRQRKTVIDFLPQNLREKRPYPVGRLDYFSQGLILLTNDGDLTNQLTHPGYEHTKIYHLHIREKAPARKLEKMRSGMTLREGEKLAPAQIRVLSTKEKGIWLEMTLTQGVNRQIRRMCRDLGLTILKLERIAHAGVSLGNLPEGKWRHLSPEEISRLKKNSPNQD